MSAGRGKNTWYCNSQLYGCPLTFVIKMNIQQLCTFGLCFQPFRNCCLELNTLKMRNLWPCWSIQIQQSDYSLNKNHKVLTGVGIWNIY